MQKLDFAEAVDLIVARDPRYDREAYSFLRDALDFTVKLRKKSRVGGRKRACERSATTRRIRHYALKQFGPMVVTVFNYWGVHRCDDLERWCTTSSVQESSGKRRPIPWRIQGRILLRRCVRHPLSAAGPYGTSPDHAGGGRSCRAAE